MNSATLVQKLWNYCNVLRDDGMSYGDYVEQLTYLLFGCPGYFAPPLTDLERAAAEREVWILGVM